MKLETDDPIYRAKLYYLGPPGYTLPINLTYAQIGVFVAILTVLLIVGLLLFRSLMVIGSSLAIADGLTHVVFRYVDADLPAFKVIKTTLTDWKRMGTPERRVAGVRTSHIRIRTEITEPADGGDR